MIIEAATGAVARIRVGAVGIDWISAGYPGNFVVWHAGPGSVTGIRIGAFRIATVAARRAVGSTGPCRRCEDPVALFTFVGWVDLAASAAGPSNQAETRIEVIITVVQVLIAGVRGASKAVTAVAGITAGTRTVLTRLVHIAEQAVITAGPVGFQIVEACAGGVARVRIIAIRVRGVTAGC